MTLYEYIEKREQELDEQMKEVMERDIFNVLAVGFVSSAISELDRIREAVEDGLID